MENHQPKQPQRTRRPWTNNLFVSDKHILLSPTAWLTDDIIGATQDLLKKEVPLGNGFQSTCCGITCAFDIESDEFIQIVHNGHGHWLTISTIGSKKGEVFVYDSMYPCVSDIVNRQIAALLATKEKEIKSSSLMCRSRVGGMIVASLLSPLRHLWCMECSQEMFGMINPRWENIYASVWKKKE